MLHYIYSYVLEAVTFNFHHSLKKYILYRNRYVEAVLLESKRLNHVTPIIGPRRVLKETSINGYSIPKVPVLMTVCVKLYSFRPTIKRSSSKISSKLKYLVCNYDRWTVICFIFIHNY